MGGLGSSSARRCCRLRLRENEMEDDSKAPKVEIELPFDGGGAVASLKQEEKLLGGETGAEAGE